MLINKKVMLPIFIAFAVPKPTPEIWRWEDNHNTSLASKNCSWMCSCGLNSLISLLFILNKFLDGYEQIDIVKCRNRHKKWMFIPRELQVEC